MGSGDSEREGMQMEPEERTAKKPGSEAGSENGVPDEPAEYTGNSNSETGNGNINGEKSDAEKNGGEKSNGDGNTGKKSSGKKSSEKKKGRKQPLPRKRKKRTLKQRVIALVIKLGIIVLVVWILLTYVGGVFICHTSDMYPSLRDGDLVITYRLGPYKSGDIVAYDYQGKIFFGRVVGEPGDEIFMDESGTFTVNGLMPYETIYYTTQVRDSDSMTFPYTVREGEYFVLADAREQGIDSRNFGPVTDMKGKVVLQIRRRGF